MLEPVDVNTGGGRGGKGIGFSVLCRGDTSKALLKAQAGESGSTFSTFLEMKV